MHVSGWVAHHDSLVRDLERHVQRSTAHWTDGLHPTDTIPRLLQAAPAAELAPLEAAWTFYQTAMRQHARPYFQKHLQTTRHFTSQFFESLPLEHLWTTPAYRTHAQQQLEHPVPDVLQPLHHLVARVGVAAAPVVSLPAWWVTWQAHACTWRSTVLAPVARYLEAIQAVETRLRPHAVVWQTWASENAPSLDACPRAAFDYRSVFGRFQQRMQEQWDQVLDQPDRATWMAFLRSRLDDLSTTSPPTTTPTAQAPCGWVWMDDRCSWVELNGLFDRMRWGWDSFAADLAALANDPVLVGADGIQSRCDLVRTTKDGMLRFQQKLQRYASPSSQSPEAMRTDAYLAHLGSDVYAYRWRVHRRLQEVERNVRSPEGEGASDDDVRASLRSALASIDPVFPACEALVQREAQVQTAWTAIHQAGRKWLDTARTLVDETVRVLVRLQLDPLQGALKANAIDARSMSTSTTERQEARPVLEAQWPDLLQRVHAFGPTFALPELPSDAAVDVLQCLQGALAQGLREAVRRSIQSKEDGRVFTRARDASAPPRDASAIRHRHRPRRRSSSLPPSPSRSL